MAPRFIWGTGIELGTLSVFSGAAGGNARSLESTTVHTGNYAVKTVGGGSRFSYWSTPPLEGGHTEMYASCWMRLASTHGQNGYGLEFLTTNGHYIGIRIPASGDGKWDGYVNGAKVADGGLDMAMPLTQWVLMEVYVKIADSGGRIISKLNGIIDVDYTGDTEPSSASEHTALRTYNDDSTSYYDDWAVAVDDWCGDIRIVSLAPDSDDTAEWEPSAAADHYTLVDERPPSDTDYISTTGTGAVDKFGLADFDGDGKAVKFVNTWGYFKKEAVDDTKIKLIADDGVVEAINTGTVLTTSYAYYSKVYNEPPSGGLWTDALVDDLIVGVESELP